MRAVLLSSENSRSDARQGLLCDKSDLALSALRTLGRLRRGIDPVHSAGEPGCGHGAWKFWSGLTTWLGIKKAPACTMYGVRFDQQLGLVAQIVPGSGGEKREIHEHRETVDGLLGLRVLIRPAERWGNGRQFDRGGVVAGPEPGGS